MILNNLESQEIDGFSKFFVILGCVAPFKSELRQNYFWYIHCYRRVNAGFSAANQRC